MNKTQVIRLIDDNIRAPYYTTGLDELKIILQLLIENQYTKEYQALQESVKHIRGIISLQNELLDRQTQRNFAEIYEN